MKLKKILTFIATTCLVLSLAPSNIAYAKEEALTDINESAENDAVLSEVSSDSYDSKEGEDKTKESLPEEDDTEIEPPVSEDDETETEAPISEDDETEEEAPVSEDDETEASGSSQATSELTSAASLKTFKQVEFVNSNHEMVKEYMEVSEYSFDFETIMTLQNIYETYFNSSVCQENEIYYLEGAYLTTLGIEMCPTDLEISFYVNEDESSFSSVKASYTNIDGELEKITLKEDEVQEELKDELEELDDTKEAEEINEAEDIDASEEATVSDEPEDTKEFEASEKMENSEEVDTSKDAEASTESDQLKATEEKTESDETSQADSSNENIVTDIKNEDIQFEEATENIDIKEDYEE